MNPTQLNSIFEPTRCPEGEQLKAYADNSLDPASVHEVERHLEDCPMCRDALEGFALVPVSFASMEELRSEVDGLAMEGTANSASSSFYSKWWMGAVAATILGTAIWWFLSPTESSFISISSNVAIETDAVADSPAEHFIGKDDEIEELVVSPTAKAPEEVEKTYRKASEIKESTPSIQSPADEEVESPENTEVALPRETEKVEPVPTLPVTSVTPEETKKQGPVKKRPTTNLRYIENYKTVNYADRDNVLQEAVIPSGSTSPKFSNVEDAYKYGSEPLTFQYSYDDVLELGIFRLKAGKYKKALQKFDLVLEHFPEDENALFYGGLAHFNLGQYAIALQYFNQISDLPSSSFDEEGAWYKALSMLQLGKRSEAKILMQKIVEEAGFYKEQAAKKLTVL